MPSHQNENIVSVPPFSHYVVLRDMKASGINYYRGEVIEPPKNWGIGVVNNLVGVKYITPIPSEAITVEVTPNDGKTRKFVNGMFATKAERTINKKTKRPEPEPEQETFDVAEHSAAQVIAFVTEHPDLLEVVTEAEMAGKNRTTLMTELLKLMEQREKVA